MPSEQAPCKSTHAQEPGAAAAIRERAMQEGGLGKAKEPLLPSQHTPCKSTRMEEQGAAAATQA